MSSLSLALSSYVQLSSSSARNAVRRVVVLYVRARVFNTRSFPPVRSPSASDITSTYWRRDRSSSVLSSARPYVARNRGHRVEFREPGLVARAEDPVSSSARSAARCVGSRQQQQDRRRSRREAVVPEAVLGTGTGEMRCSGK
ncbi:unnamed protein product [Lasius platythorax]|uniref:Uncharacterized protein n=1 Tax=Lasius platythorax TaxID=488582 RepID=A0AAV2NQJ9_9HYME